MSECKLYLNLMPHLDQQNFIYNCLENILVEEKYSKLNVLEIGSHEVGPSQKIKKYLKDHNYIGIDLIKGPGVDVVMNGEDIHKFNYKFDIMVSGECFEHAVNWKKIFNEMGTLDPSNDKIPSEKAISVADGIAQPFNVSVFSKFIAT